MLDIVCIICSESFTESHEVYITYCGHLFDYRCLIQWFQRSKSCPQCRKHCTESQIQKVFFTLSESLPSTSSASRNVILENDLQDTEDEDIYDLLVKADEVIRVLAETDYEEIETIFALKEKVQEKEGTIMSYVEEVNRLKDEIIALQVKVSSIECERERCEYKGTDLNNIMGTLKCDLQTESEIRKDSELRLIQLDKIFLSPKDEKNVRNEGATDDNRPTQAESAVPIASQVAQAVTGKQVENRDDVKVPNLVGSALPITTPAGPAPQNLTSEGLTNRQAEQLWSLSPSTSLAGLHPSHQDADRIYRWVSGYPLAQPVQLVLESDGSQVSSDVNSRSADSKQLLRLAKDRASIAGWKFVWRKYGQILARKEEFSKVIRIKNINDIQKIE